MTITLAGRRVQVGPRAAVRTMRGEVGAMSWPLRLWLLALMGLMGIGAVGALLAIPAGDEVFGTTPTVEWGLLIAAYVLFVVTTSGLCLVSSLGTVFGIEAFAPVARRAVVMAALCLMAGFGIIALDLHWPLRLLFGVVLSPSPLSPMWWMGTVYGIYLVFLIIELVGMFGGWHRIARLGGSLALVTAIVAPSTLGAVFGVLVVRPAWHGPFMPAYLLATAVLSGAAMLALLYALVARFSLRGHGPASERALTAIGRLLAAAVGAGIFLTAWQMIVGLYGGEPGSSEAAQAQLTGPLALQWWVVRVIIGLLIPFVLLVVPRLRTRAGIGIAGALVLVGLVADRSGFVMAGQIAPATSASGVVSDPWAVYTPSLVEVSIVVGAAALVAFLYTLAERYLDLTEPVAEHPAGSVAGSEVAPARAPADAQGVA